jgi:eukaryotic-like serine/threonine-protein kinase
MDALRADRWKELSPYLDAALDLDEAARTAWIADLRVSQPRVAADVEALLADREAIGASRFLEDEPDPVSLAGTSLGAYRLVSPLGQGGMGTVWLADRADGRYEGQVAVKLLHVSLVNRAGQERFAREGSMLARLNHPAVAHLIDAGLSSSGQPYLVLEYVEGDHIDRYCDRHGLTVEQRLRLFLDVLGAVAHAHASLVVHRDIKPSNVLVTGDGRVKLLDFGIATLIEPEGSSETAALTADGTRVLTPAYASPEQLTGAPITTATDVYALGVLLYVLLGGRHPAGETGTPAALVRAIIDTDPQPPSQVASSAPLRRVLRGDLDTIVGKALRKVPADRYASAVAFADDIRRYLAHEPVTARPQTWRYRAGKLVRRHPLGVLASAAAVLLLAAIVGFYTASLARERDRARVEADKAVRVSALLTDLLSAADPYARRDNREPTVRGVLDASAERLSRDLIEQPDVRADLLALVGRAYGRLGVDDRARALLEEAVPLARRVHGNEHVRVAQALNDLGVVLRRAGESAAAQPLLDEALALRRRLLGDEHPEVAVTLVERGRLHMDAGERGQAETMFRESLRIRRAALGDDHSETSTSLSELGLLLWTSGDAAGAEPLFRQSLAISRQALGDDHPNVSSGLNNLALALGGQGDWAGAEAAQRESVAIGRRVLGPRHRDMGPKLVNLSVSLIEQRRFDEAATVLAEAVGIATAAFGADHPSLAGYRFFQARVHLGKGQGLQAEALLRDVLDTRVRTLPAGSWRIGQAHSALGEALSLQGRYADAEAALVAALETLTSGPGQPGREHGLARTRLAVARDAGTGSVHPSTRR